jgi:thiamine kinase-like enzyme
MLASANTPEKATNLLEKLQQVRGWTGKRIMVEPLRGGITNENYRVMVEGHAYVARVPAQKGDLLGIDREVELQANRLAAGAGVAAEVIDFIRPDAILITRFIEGRPVGDAAVHLPDTLTRLAQSLQAVHSSGVLPAAFSPFRVVEAYLKTAGVHGVSAPSWWERAHEVGRRIEGALPQEDPCLCHNDLLNANFIDEGERIRIVDWEYAGMGDPFFDLGNFSVNHQLGEDEEVFLLEQYFGSATPGQLAHLRLMRIMSDYREAMWGLVQQGISELDFDFKAYCQKHADRMLEAAGPDRLTMLLDKVNA